MMFDLLLKQKHLSMNSPLILLLDQRQHSTVLHDFLHSSLAMAVLKKN